METIIEKAKNVRLLALDMDGVMTDGRLALSDVGEVQRYFYVHDGQGLIWLQKSGVEVAIITKCNSDVVPMRMQMLGIKHVYRGQTDKRVAYVELLDKLKLKPQQVAYMGDDLPDMPLILESGLGITVPNGDAELKSRADWCTERAGGNGAVREVCETIMRAQGTFQSLIEQYQVMANYATD